MKQGVIVFYFIVDKYLFTFTRNYSVTDIRHHLMIQYITKLSYFLKKLLTYYGFFKKKVNKSKFAYLEFYR